MIDGNLVLVHGFWSSPATWHRLAEHIEADRDLRGLSVHRFRYESPKLRLPFSATRIPDYNDIAQSVDPYIRHVAPDGPLAFVTHSQGGLILQRYLAWMLNEGRGRELTRIALIVLLSCPNEGSEYLRSLRTAAGLRRHPQARDLQTFSADVTAARRTVLNQIVAATQVSERTCPIPIYVYAGRTDNVVRRGSAQGSFPNASILPGNHSSILDPEATGSLTVPTLKRHLMAAFGEQPSAPASPGHVGSPAGATEPPLAPNPLPPSPSSRYNITVTGSKGVQVGDNNTQHNHF